MLNLSIVAAVSKNGVIGRGKKLPWRMPSDLQRFKEITAGHVIVMGTKALISIPGKLNKRAVVTISRREKPRMITMPGDMKVFISDNLEEILPVIAEVMPDISQDEIFIVGGQGIYEAFLPRVQRMYLTEIDCEINDGDTFFPVGKIDQDAWKVTQELRFEPQDGDEFASTFRVYELR